MATENLNAFPKPELWVLKGLIYRVRSKAYGDFVAECVVAHSSWAEFRLREVTPQLEEDGYRVGQVIEVSKELCRAEAAYSPVSGN